MNRVKTFLACFLALLTLSMTSVQAAVPAEVTTAIADVQATGTAVFAALIIVALPFIAWRLVRKIRG